MMKEIASPQNEVFRSLRDALTAKGIKKHGLFLISGERAVRDAMALKPELVRDLLITPEMQTSPLVTSLGRRGTLISLSHALFDELDVFGVRAPILVMKTPEIATADLGQAPQGLEVLCALSDPSNVGALLRSAAALGARRVVLLKESASPFLPKAVRAASAATLAIELARGPSIQEIATANGPIMALDMAGEPLPGVKWPKDARLLLGEEGLGVPKSSAFRFVSIPMEEGVESLNATIAASIALYAYRASQNSSATDKPY